MSLLRDIQIAATSGTGSVADLLRKCKILAARLKSDKFAVWVEYELNGYPAEADLPPHRMLEGLDSFGQFLGPFGSQMNNASIPLSLLPEEAQPFAGSEPLTGGIAMYEQLLRSPGYDAFESLWPPDVVRVMAQRIYRDYVCVRAWKAIPRTAIVSLLDTVRNQILGFALDIERENPAAGEAASNETPVAVDKVNQVFNSHFYGPVGNVAAGSTGVSQSATMNITRGDLDALKAELAKLGVPAADIESLSAAVTGDAKAGEKGFGARVTQWLGTAFQKVASGAWSLSMSTATSVLPKLISQYLGVPIA